MQQRKSFWEYRTDMKICNNYLIGKIMEQCESSYCPCGLRQDLRNTLRVYHTNPNDLVLPSTTLSSCFSTPLPMGWFGLATSTNKVTILTLLTHSRLAIRSI